MDPLVLSFMNLFGVASALQEQAWGTLPVRYQRALNDFNRVQLKCLMSVWLREANGAQPYTQTQLGELLNTPKAQTSRLISEVVEHGLLVRSPDPENRRFLRVSLTAKGRKVGGVISEAVTRLLGQLFSELTEEEHAHLLHLTGKLCATYSAKVAES